MKTKSSITKKGYNFERSTYNPTLDYFIGKGLGKEKVEAARVFIKEHGLPVRFMKKSDS